LTDSAPILHIITTIVLKLPRHNNDKTQKQRSSPDYMWGLTFYSHVENTCTTASIQGGFGPTNSLTPPLFIAIPVAARKENSHIFVC